MSEIADIALRLQRVEIERERAQRQEGSCADERRFLRYAAIPLR